LITPKKIVIIGSSFAGRMIAQQLKGLDPQEQLEILIIDQSPHFEFICSNYKALCDENVFEDHMIDNNEAVLSFSSPNITFKQGKLLSIRSDGKFIHIEKPLPTRASFLAKEKEVI